jgi:cyclic pyranopterin phosphate synthase
MPYENMNHFDEEGKAVMVDVTKKNDTERAAVARSTVKMLPETLDLIKKGEMGKGDVLGVARVAGIMAVKKTSELIPMCHPLMLTGAEINFIINEEKSEITIEAVTKLCGKTGVEMEALTAVSVAGLTIYDMCKAVDKRISINNIHLVKKSGGKSGTFVG